MQRPQILSLPERLDCDPDATGKGVVVAFVDSGFYPHPDLMRPQSRLRAYVDVTTDKPNPVDFTTPHVRAWHGTMASCCAVGNGYLSGGRYRGLASRAQAVLVRAATTRGPFRAKHIADGLRVPLRYPELAVRIVSVSLGANVDDPDAKDVLRAVEELWAAGILVIAAAGNTAGVPPSPPASSPSALTVGGLDDRNTLEKGDDTPWPSSAGNGKPDLLAPSVYLPSPMLPGTSVAREAAALFNILSILEEEEDEQRFARETGSPHGEREEASLAGFAAAMARRIADRKYISPDYQHVDGTSFAAPIVASVAAQMLEVQPKLTALEVRKGLLATADRQARLPNELQGAGVVSPKAAVEWARKKVPPAKKK